MPQLAGMRSQLARVGAAGRDEESIGQGGFVLRAREPCALAPQLCFIYQTL